MVITSLQEKENRKFYVPIRPGNRGGWSLFEWQSVREMPYRDREMYLGNSAVIGVLDKGGKWRKRDWYLKTDKRYGQGQMNQEMSEAIRKDHERMNSALGITEKDDEEKLSEEELKQMMRRLKKKDGKEVQYEEAVGLGFDKSKVEIKGKPTLNKDGITRLEGYNQMADEKEKQRSRSRKKEKKRKEKKRKHRNHSSSEEESQPKYRTMKEANQKQKQHKKDKKKRKRHHSSSQESQPNYRTMKDGREVDEKKKKKNKKRHRNHSSSEESHHRYRTMKEASRRSKQKHERKQKSRKHKRHYSDQE